MSNGKGISSIAKQSTSGLVDTYKISYNDGTSTTFTVTNGAKGDKGDNAYLWIKYASQKPTAGSHSIGDVPDDWIGVYSGNSATAPTDYAQYNWFQYKGDKGDKGDPASLLSWEVKYQVSDSGTIIPSGAWYPSVPVVEQGKYLWARTTQNYNTGSPVVSYSVSRMGLDGAGSVSSVASVSPDSNGNVPLTATDIEAVPSTGGDMTGELRMNGQPISGLNSPREDTQAANKGYVDSAVHLGAISVRGSSASLTLAAGKITALTLDTVIAQDGVGEFSFSDGGVKVPLDGIVLVSGSVYINGSTTDTTMMEGAYVYKNDTEVAGVWMYQHTTSSIATPIALVAVNAGDVIHLKARRYGAGDCLPSAAGTHLDIMYV